jgi:FkbM family methyltransferase
MSPLVRAVGLRLRRYVLPLVGYWDIAARLDALGAPAAHGGRETVLPERLAMPEKHLEALVTQEVDRLDGYLVHHVAALRAELAALRDEIRRNRVYAAAGVGTLMIFQDFDLVLPPQEVGLLACLLRNGPEAVERGVGAVLRDRLRPGDAAVDAGANIGLHALTMAKAIGPAGKLICFEPVPHLADALTLALRLNGFADYACVERAALSDTPGEATLHVAAHSPLSSLFALSDSTGSRPIAVSKSSLDSALPSGSRLNLVNLDVEGAEPSVWRGMQRVRQECPDLDIVLGWSSSHFARSGESAAEFYRAIRADGFSVFVIEDAPKAGRLAPVADAVGAATLEGVNLLLTRRL